MIDSEVETEIVPVLQVSKEGNISTSQVPVSKEFPLTIILNDQELVTLLCSPRNLDYLAVGYLSSEGFLKSRDEIKRVLVDDQRGVVRLETKETREVAQDVLFKRLITSGCGRGASFYSAADIESHKVSSEAKVSASEVFALVNKFQHSSQIYLATHGVHSAALCDAERILVFSEDIGRHNAIDKIFGECMLRGIPIQDRIIIASGRISSEMLHKVAKKDIPILISISAPTNLGVKLANDLGITLIGSVRGGKANIYSNEWRVDTSSTTQ